MSNYGFKIKNKILDNEHSSNFIILKFKDRQRSDTTVTYNKNFDLGDIQFAILLTPNLPLPDGYDTWYGYAGAHIEAYSNNNITYNVFSGSGINQRTVNYEPEIQILVFYKPKPYDVRYGIKPYLIKHLYLGNEETYIGNDRNIDINEPFVITYTSDYITLLGGTNYTIDVGNQVVVKIRRIKNFPLNNYTYGINIKKDNQIVLNLQTDMLTAKKFATVKGTNKLSYSGYIFCLFTDRYSRGVDEDVMGVIVDEHRIMVKDGDVHFKPFRYITNHEYGNAGEVDKNFGSTDIFLVS